MNTLDKPSLRQELLHQREQLSEASRAEYAQSWSKKLMALLQEKPFQTIAGYNPIRGELDVLPALEALRDQGKIVLLPRTPEEPGPLSFHAYEADKLETGKYGILQPLAESPVHLPDILLVPLVACTADGHRLGYGGGYYDRTLASLSPRSFTIGCAYEFQLVESFPAQPHDMQLDTILTV